MITGDTKTHFERGARVMVKPEYHDYGRRGTCLGLSVFKDQWWTPIIWDGQDDPDFFKTDGLTRAEGKD